MGFVLFLLLVSLFPLANASLAGGFAGRRFWFGCGFFCLLLIQSICRLQGPFVLVICFSCLLSCKDRAFSATSATLEEKKDVEAGDAVPEILVEGPADSVTIHNDLVVTPTSPIKLLRDACKWLSISQAGSKVRM